jgi:hypothetical protein
VARVSTGGMILRMPREAWLTGALAALAFGAAACGGDGDDRPPAAATPRATAAPEATATGEPEATATAEPEATAMAEPEATVTPEPEATPEPESSPPDAADVRTVREWADTLRAGRIRAAARYFALPSLVSNGTPPIKLETRAETEFFNRTLPCGAKLIGTEPAPRGFFIATFRLTERPGAGECGSGTGETARTAFRVRDAHITDWLRVQDIESAPETLS